MTITKIEIDAFDRLAISLLAEKHSVTVDRIMYHGLIPSNRREWLLPCGNHEPSPYWHRPVVDCEEPFVVADETEEAMYRVGVCHDCGAVHVVRQIRRRSEKV